jgi:hypothetical protein
MYYGPYYDPTGRTQFIKELWKTTNARNSAHAKMMAENNAERRRLRDLSLSGNRSSGNGNSGSSGSGASFWLAGGLVLGGWVLLHLL